MDKQRVARISVGVFFIIALISLLFMTILLSNKLSWNKKYYQLTAKFSNAGSLVKGAPVKIAGVVIGIVDDIHLDDQQQKAVVSLTIEDKYKINTDATAQIISAGIFGEQYVNIVMGSDTIYLTNHQSFMYTNSAFILENLINRMIGSNFIK